MEVANGYDELLQLSKLSHLSACAHCGETTDAPLRCGRCKSAFYCNKEHQRAAYPQHRLACAEACLNDAHQSESLIGAAVGDSVDETRRSLLGHFYALVNQLGGVVQTIVWRALVGLPLRVIERAVELVVKIANTSVTTGKAYLCQLAQLLPDLLSTIKSILYRSTGDVPPTEAMPPADSIPWRTLVKNDQEAARMAKLSTEADICAQFFDTSVGGALLELMRSIALSLLSPLATVLEYVLKAIEFSVESVVAGIEWAYQTAVVTTKRVRGVVADLMPVVIFASELPVNVGSELSADLFSARETAGDAISTVMPILQRFWRNYVKKDESAQAPQELVEAIEEAPNYSWAEMLVLGKARFAQFVEKAVEWILFVVTNPPVWAFRQLLRLLTPATSRFVGHMLTTLGDALSNAGMLKNAFDITSSVSGANKTIRILSEPEIRDWGINDDTSAEHRENNKQAWEAYRAMFAWIAEGKKARAALRRNRGMIAVSTELNTTTWKLSTQAARFMRGEQFSDEEQRRVQQLTSRLHELRTGQNEELTKKVEQAADDVTKYGSLTMNGFLDDTLPLAQAKVGANDNGDDPDTVAYLAARARRHNRRTWSTTASGIVNDIYLHYTGNPKVPKDILQVYADLTDTRNPSLSTTALQEILTEERIVHTAWYAGMAAALFAVGVVQLWSGYKTRDDFNFFTSVTALTGTGKDFFINTGRALLGNQVAVELRHIYDAITKYERNRDARIEKFNEATKALSAPTTALIQQPDIKMRTLEQKLQDDLREEVHIAAQTMSANNMRYALTREYVVQRHEPYDPQEKRVPVDLHVPRALEVAKSIQLDESGQSVTPASVVAITHDPEFQRFMDETRWRQYMDEQSILDGQTALGGGAIIKDVFEEKLKPALAKNPGLQAQTEREYKLFAYGRTHAYRATATVAETATVVRDKYLDSAAYTGTFKADEELEKRAETALVVPSDDATKPGTITLARQKGGSLTTFGNNAVVHVWTQDVVTRHSNGLGIWRSVITDNWSSDLGAVAWQLWDHMTYGANAEIVFTKALFSATGLSDLASGAPAGWEFTQSRFWWINPANWLNYFWNVSQAIGRTINEWVIQHIRNLDQTVTGVRVKNLLRAFNTGISLVWWWSAISAVLDLLIYFSLRARHRNDKLYHEQLAKYSDPLWFSGRIATLLSLVASTSLIQGALLDIFTEGSAIALFWSGTIIATLWVFGPLLRFGVGVVLRR